MSTSSYDLTPHIEVPGFSGACERGWPDVVETLARSVGRSGVRVVALETYPGVFLNEIRDALRTHRPDWAVVESADAMLDEAEIDKRVAPFLGGDDPIFGWMTSLRLRDLFDDMRLEALRARVAKLRSDASAAVLVLGPGATIVAGDYDLLVYADMPRWEAQLRMRRDEIDNLGVSNRGLKWSLQYKRAYFVDWRVADRHKRTLFDRWDHLLDTTTPGLPVLVAAEAVRAGLDAAARRPFRVVPFFDPAPWGGQWMKEACGLDRSAANYGWCFDCVPEENSLRFTFGDTTAEMPAQNLVFTHPRELLGEEVYARFGAEFPIRFDFLDTIGGGNLSLQVHPLVDFIQNEFGMHYTQDESYYMLDADETATVYLGLTEDAEPTEMLKELRAAQRGEGEFDAQRHVNRFPVRRHDHVLIPAGTIHCSGAGAMVLEISATPYIFTFKLWDWGRLGLDGLPRPINLERGEASIQWDRRTKWVKDNLLNRTEPVARGEEWREERTGLHELEFIETRRHWFTGRVPHDTGGGVNVLNLVQGAQAIVESPEGSFEPFVVHYAETFIVPAAVGRYTIRPHGPAVGSECATMKAFVRTGGGL